MWICKYFIAFIFFSFLGWIWETVYCIIGKGRWESRGFLFGPICPIYGVGAMAGFAIVDIFNLLGLPALKWWQVVCIAFFGSAALEYSTSYVLEKLFHAYWWDYSRMPLNIHGRICLPASLLFAGAGLLVVYVFYPFCTRVAASVSPAWFELLSLVLLAVLTVDMTLTVSSLTDIQKRVCAMDESITEHMTEFVDNLFQNTTPVSRRALARMKGVRFKTPTHTDTYRILMERVKKKNKP